MLEYAAPAMNTTRNAAAPAMNTTRNADRDIVSQIKLAFANPLPLLIGSLIGGLVPIATYTVGHLELGTVGWSSVPGAVVVGGCLFSAITVYKWGRRAFDSAFKALGFVVLSEGVMTFSQTPWLSLLMLGFLVAINAVANGANLAIAHLDAEIQLAGVVPRAPLPQALAVQVPVSAPTDADPGAVEGRPASRKPARKRSKAARARTAVSAAQLN